VSRRYPLSPLLEATGLSLSALAQRVGIGGGEYRRIQAEGVSELLADRWANRLGLHPAEVWPDFGMVLCAECGAPFAPARRARFCSTRCYQRQYQRAWRKRREDTDPAFKAMRREVTTRWKAEARETVRKKDRLYYQRNRDRILERARRRYREQKAA
jgi:hypothetical protein